MNVAANRLTGHSKLSYFDVNENQRTGEANCRRMTQSPAYTLSNRRSSIPYICRRLASRIVPDKGSLHRGSHLGTNIGRTPTANTRLNNLGLSSPIVTATTFIFIRVSQACG